MTKADLPREIIINAYARWTALSALRSGAPIKSRRDIYPLLDKAQFDAVVRPEPITAAKFDQWHRDAAERLSKEGRVRIPIGWSTKLLNIYLKTAVYVGGLGHPRLREHLHPPIDGGLWSGLARRFEMGSDVCRLTHHRTKIADIKGYDDYLVIINGCKLAAKQARCLLIEVEQWWEGASTGGK